ncbi:MAG: hypothetical protein OXR66_02570 [Candidatus Woesearchaeota archaeon]|nr:hypothetical protein [Candidatus Woesearchaeota archaeon]
MDLVQLRKKNIELTKAAIQKSVTPDVHIIHARNTIAELDKVANALVKRLRDWYKHHNPELEHANQEHEDFIAAVLEYQTPDAEGMGAPVSKETVDVYAQQAVLVQQLYAQREQVLTYLEKAMQARTPNLLHIAGAMIGGELLVLAGSLRRLATMPAGTIQLLGAESAMFRHLRKNAKPPKHGVIFNHELMQRAHPKLHGKIARTLADTISIGARVDFFEGDFCGDTLLAKVEKVCNG